MPEDGGSMFHQNVGIYLKIHTYLLPRRPKLTSLLQEQRIQSHKTTNTNRTTSQTRQFRHLIIIRTLSENNPLQVYGNVRKHRCMKLYKAQFQIFLSTMRRSNQVHPAAILTHKDKSSSSRCIQYMAWFGPRFLLHLTTLVNCRPVCYDA